MKSLITASILILFFTNCSLTKTESKKINGVSFVASSEAVTQKNIDPILNIYANHAAIMPFGFIKKLNDPILQFDDKNRWYGETERGVKQYISKLQENNIQVMLKPQIWVWHGEFTGNIKMTSEDDWNTFEKTYRDFILTYARIAEEKQVSILCIGTELEKFVAHSPKYWENLILEIRSIYKGKLTYAANWDEYTKTTFWKKLEYIGIDGYFPLSKLKTPTPKALKKGWVKHKVKMKKVSDSIRKKILFTEFGYRSVDYSGSKPWNIDYSKTSVNLKGQSIALQVLFDELWNEEWFAGGYIWKWFIDYEKSGGIHDSRFTPQNKPAEEILKKHYETYKIKNRE